MKTGTIRIMRIVTIEEHFTAAMYRQHVGATEYRNFFVELMTEKQVISFRLVLRLEWPDGFFVPA
jgi:hypothetical protein